MAARLYIPVLLLLTLSQPACSQSTSTSRNGSLKSDSIKEAHLDSLRYIPRPVGWVNDYIHLFTEEQAKDLDRILTSYEKRTGTEIVVTTVDSAHLGPMHFEAYALLMLRNWGVGKKEKNNGILILIVRDLRRIRIENGYGIERLITNEETAGIIESHIIPRFREEKFYEGTRDGILAMINKLDQRH
jgi:uncharacterized protein